MRQDIPAAIGVSIPTNIPRISGGWSDTINIKRREFVCSFGNGAATTFYMVPQSYNIPGWDLNPGCSLLFPWLSGLATHFERFRFRNLKFTFVSSAATSNPGRYYAAVDYDYDDAPANSKVQLMGNRTANEASVWQPMELVCNPASLHRDMPTKFVSVASRNNYVEPRTAYCGYLMVAIDTTQSDRIWDMWVTYDVDLITPVTDELFVQDGITGFSPPAVAAVTSAIGTGFSANPYIRPISVGPVRVVTPGSAGVPRITYVTGGETVEAANAIDLGAFLNSASTNGRFLLKYLGSETGVTPATLLSTKAMAAFAYMYDSAGNQLGELWNLISGKTEVRGCDSSSSFGTAGNKVADMVTVLTKELYANYPSLRYIVPIITTIGTFAGAGTSGFAFKAEL